MAQNDEEPSAHLRLKMEAHAHENAARWEEAEKCHRRALALAEAVGAPMTIYKDHSDLSALYALRGMQDRALEEARLALEAARRDSLPIIHSMGLQTFGRRCLAAGDLEKASEVAEEWVRITPAGRLHDLTRTQALVFRANCHLQRSRLPEARADLDAAWPILGPHSQSEFGVGYLACLAGWWEATARIREHDGDLIGAAHALGRVVEFRRRVARAPQLEGPYKYHSLASALERYADALTTAGRTEEAENASDESKAICERIEAGGGGLAGD